VKTYKNDISEYLISKKIPVYLSKNNCRNTRLQNWHKNKRIYVVDYGSQKRNFFILDCHRKKFVAMTIEEFIKFPIKRKNSIIIVEYAHMQSSEGISLSQPLSPAQKQEFLDNCNSANICLKYFPENKTPKARDFAQKIHPALSKKTDMHDVISIYLYLKYFPNIYSTLSSLDSIKTPIVIEAQRFRIQTNIILNKGRFNEYVGDSIADFIEEHKESLYEYLKDIPEALEILDVTKDKKNNIKLNTKIFYTVLATLLDNEGNKRLRESTGQTPGWKFISDREFCLNQNKGEVSKSNLNYHFARHSFARKFDFAKSKKENKRAKTFNKLLDFNENQYEEFINHRKLVKSILRKIFYYFKEKLSNK
jgi:hypothetical protein